MQRFHALVFDLDDTLYPEREFVRSGFSAVALWAQEHLGLDGSRSFASLWALFERGVRGNTFDLWLEEEGVAPAGHVKEIVGVYRNHTPAISAYPDVSRALDLFRPGHRLGIVSDGDPEIQLRKLRALGLGSYFDAVVVSDMPGVQARKPSPKPFHAVLDRLGVHGEKAVYIADNPLKDFAGARAAAMSTVRVRRPGGLYSQSEAPSEAYEPDLEVESMSALTALIEQSPAST